MQFCLRSSDRRAGAQAEPVHLADRRLLLVGAGAGLSAADPDHLRGHVEALAAGEELPDTGGGAAGLRHRDVRESVAAAPGAVRERCADALTMDVRREWDNVCVGFT